MKHQAAPIRIGIQHGAGYVGRELISLIHGHPVFSLGGISSESYAGHCVSETHPQLRSIFETRFCPSLCDIQGELDVAILCAPHGSGAEEVVELRGAGFDGPILDMSSDLRFSDEDVFEQRFSRPHPAPDLLKEAVYGLPEVTPVDPGTRLIANPGCFATAIALSLYPLKSLVMEGPVAITALTGASGSGARAGAGTHFPDREGNVRAYRVMTHDHEAEVQHILEGAIELSFVPASGPWTRGIWGTAHIPLGEECSSETISTLFKDAYRDTPLVRLWSDKLPELHFAVGTPFCDLGWVLSGQRLVVGFALDNLLKGAASQAVQNINLCTGLDSHTGLVPMVSDSLNQI